MKKAISMFAVAALAAGVFAAQAGSQAKPAGGVGRLTTLVGEWNATPEGGKTFISTIRFVSNGTALEETFDDGEKHNQMVTLYTADGDRLADGRDVRPFALRLCAHGLAEHRALVSCLQLALVFRSRRERIAPIAQPDSPH